MKKIILALTAIAGLFLGNLYAANRTSIEIDRSTYALDTGDIVNVQGYRSLSAQLNYSTAAPTFQTIKCGIAPFSQINVTDWRQVQGRASTMTFTIPFPKNTVLDATTPYLTINGKSLNYGVHWSSGMFSSNTIINLAAAVTTYANGEYFATASTNILTIWAMSTGSYANSWYATSSTGAVVSIGTSTTSNWMGYFSYGNNPGYISINNIRLTEGTSFFALRTASDTAKAISNSIATHNPFSGVVVSSHSGSVIYATAAVNSANQLDISPGPGLAIVNTSTISQTPNISIDLDTITISGHSFGSGLPVLVTTQSPNITPTGLLSGVTYFVVAINENMFRLAPTKVIASTGGYINISALAVNNSTITLTPAPPSVLGTSGFKWQASNDGSSWTDLAITTVTSTNIRVGGTSLWDFDDPPYKYLRGVLSSTTFGGINLKAIFYGREE